MFTSRDPLLLLPCKKKKKKIEDFFAEVVFKTAWVSFTPMLVFGKPARVQL